MNTLDSFLLFSINENKCQLFLALDFSCLKEVEGITTNPFNQNIFFYEETQFDSKFSSETKGEMNLFTIISSQRYFFYSKASRCADFGSRKKPCSSKPHFVRFIPMYGSGYFFKKQCNFKASVYLEVTVM